MSGATGRRGIDISIGGRLTIGFSMAVLLLAVGASGAIVAMRSIVTQVDRLNLTIEPRQEAAIELQRAFLMQAISARNCAIRPDDASFFAYGRAVEGAREALGNLARLPKDPDGAAIFQQITKDAEEYTTRTDTFTEMIRPGGQAGDIAAAEREMGDARFRLIEKLQDYLDLQGRKTEEAHARIRTQERRALEWFVPLAALMVLALVGTAALTTTAVRRPALTLVEEARKLARSARLPGPDGAAGQEDEAVATRHDELQELSDSFHRMADAIERRQRRLSASNRLSIVLGSHLDAAAISSEALEEILDFAGCEFGAVYVLDGDSGVLRRSAAHALDAAADSIPIGEGIPGEAALSGRTVHVRDIPADSPFRVRFGFDDLPARSVLAIPILFQERPNGVLLLGSLREIDPAEVAFMEEGARRLGTSLQNALNHRRVQNLAGELQAKNAVLQTQNEKLQAQSEEIQSQNEELQAQSEELQAQSEELQAQNEELQTQGERIQAQSEELQAQNEQLQAQSEELQAQSEELQAQNEELQTQRESLKEADRRKDEFLAVLGHELRNPLAAIAHANFIIQRDGAKPEEIAQCREIISRQTAHLTRIVDDLLDVARITTDKIQLRKQPVALSDMVLQAVESCRSFIEARGHDFTISLPREPIWIEADPTRLEQIMINLLNNAAKFTEPHGRIEVKVDREGRFAIIRVRDNGIGIAPDALETIFDLPRRLHQPFTHHQPGLGLGLKLVHRLAELHGGTVAAHSDGPGKGSEFVVRIPALPSGTTGSAASNEALADEGPAGKHGDTRGPLRVLVVEDNPDVAQSVAKIVSMWGHDVRVANAAMIAIEKAIADPPDVVLLDIGLPEMDGYQVARRMRSGIGGRAHTRFLAMTGYGRPEDVRKAYEAGFERHLTKPVDFDELRKALLGDGKLEPA